MLQYVDPDLGLDTRGHIKYLPLSLQSKQYDINLYFKINKGEIPFNRFGNNLIHYIFAAYDKDDISNLVYELIQDIQTRFYISIPNFNISIADDKIYLTLNLQNDQTMDFIIGSTIK